jgi:hypothetical protein
MCMNEILLEKIHFFLLICQTKSVNWFWNFWLLDKSLFLGSFRLSQFGVVSPHIFERDIERLFCCFNFLKSHAIFVYFRGIKNSEHHNTQVKDVSPIQLLLLFIKFFLELALQQQPIYKVSSNQMSLPKYVSSKHQKVFFWVLFSVWNTL